MFIKVRVEIAPEARENECYNNCVERVAKDGGSVVVGWRRTPATTRGNLIASLDHHAVWKTSSGELVDISPRVVNQRDTLRIVRDEEIEFEEDATATFATGCKSLPSKYVVTGDDKWGFLKEACERSAKADDYDRNGDASKAAYERKKVTDLLNRHWKRATGS